MLVEVRTRVDRVLGKLRLQVQPVFVMVEEGLEVHDRSEFGSTTRGGGALGLEGGGEVVVERAEDGVVVGGTIWGDAALEEGGGQGRAQGCMDGAGDGEEAIIVACGCGFVSVGVWVVGGGSIGLGGVDSCLWGR